MRPEARRKCGNCGHWCLKPICGTQECPNCGRFKPFVGELPTFVKDSND